jgi:vacuolar-type H+-ATPase subunit H
MASTGETMDQKTKRAAADAKSGASEFADTAREKAREMAGEARERAYEYGREYKDEAASETSKIANALRKASEDLHDGSPQERIFAKLADTVADTADGMREMELDEMAYAVNDFARRNSAAFLGGAALLGFVAARFMKASARHDDYRRSGSFGSNDLGDDRYSPDVTPNDYDEDDRISRPVPTSAPVTSAAPRPAPTTTTQPAARPATTSATTGTAGSTGSTGGMSGDISRGTTTTGGTGSISSGSSSTGSTGSSSTGSTGSVGGIDKPDEKPEIPGAPQPGTTGAVKK